MNHCDTAKKRTWAILTSSPLTSILIPKIPSGLKLSAPYSISFFYLAINSDSIDFCVHCLEGREKSYRGSHSLTLVINGPGYHPRWITVRFLSLQSLQEAFFKSNICAAAFFPIIILWNLSCSKPPKGGDHTRCLLSFSQHSSDCTYFRQSVITCWCAWVCTCRSKAYATVH